MNLNFKLNNRTLGWCAAVWLASGFWAATVMAPLHAESAETFNQKVSSATEQAAQSIDETGKAAANKLEQLWERIDAKRLKNRTVDEIVAWVIMGLLVGGVLAQFMRVNRVGALALGLGGSLIGGMVVHVAQIDLGLGPVLIRYEDLLFSLAGSLLVILAIRLLMKRKTQKT